MSGGEEAGLVQAVTGLDSVSKEKRMANGGWSLEGMTSFWGFIRSGGIGPSHSAELDAAAGGRRNTQEQLSIEITDIMLG